MKSAVDRVYALLTLKDENPEQYESRIQFGERYTRSWDEPRMPKRFKGWRLFTGLIGPCKAL